MRETDRDTSFLRRHLTEELIRELDLFQYQRKGNDVRHHRGRRRRGLARVKDTLIANVGMNTRAGHPRRSTATAAASAPSYLEHVHDGRDLHPEYAERTLAFVYQLWQREVALETVMGGKRQVLVHNDRGFTVKAL